MDVWFSARLDHVSKIFKHIEEAEAVQEILSILEAPHLALDTISRMHLYAESLPKAQEYPLTAAQRNLHFLWDYFDKLPLALIIQFSIPFRRMIAERLFGRCGDAFIAEENFRFNFAQLLNVGDRVFINRNVFIDTKGGVTLGNGVAIAEDVRVFTHSHSESSHIDRTYHHVIIGDYVKVYSGSTILPGVTIGKQAIVAAGSLVAHDVPDNMVVAGRPAKILRERRTDGKQGDDLDHIWLY
jgi:acetyltransferase-like isoleucine patch superfamily enzyme